MLKSVSLNVFAKAPIHGQTKTRLAKSIGDDAAVYWYQRMVWHCLQQAEQYDKGPIHLYVTPDPEHAFFKSCQENFSIRILPQQGAHLGERMANAVRDELEHHDGAIIIGTDCPAIQFDYLNAAQKVLTQSDCVLGPSLDGGYVLIGLRQYATKVFEGIDWGSTHVLTQTRQQLHSCTLTWQELAPLRDIDFMTDLHVYIDALRKIKLANAI